MKNHYVYELYGPDGILYVGCSSDIGYRLNSHTATQPWWPDVTRIEVTTYPTAEAGLQAEAERIWELDPPFNKNNTRHWDRGTSWQTRLRNQETRHARGERCPNRGCSQCNKKRNAERMAAIAERLRTSPPNTS